MLISSSSSSLSSSSFHITFRSSLSSFGKPWISFGFFFLRIWEGIVSFLSYSPDRNCVLAFAVTTSLSTNLMKVLWDVKSGSVKDITNVRNWG